MLAAPSSEAAHGHAVSHAASAAPQPALDSDEAPQPHMPTSTSAESASQGSNDARMTTTPRRPQLSPLWRSASASSSPSRDSPTSGSRTRRTSASAIPTLASLQLALDDDGDDGDLGSPRRERDDRQALTPRGLGHGGSNDSTPRASRSGSFFSARDSVPRLCIDLSPSDSSHASEAGDVRPIPSLIGPEALPYARCPSGTDAYSYVGTNLDPDYLDSSPASRGRAPSLVGILGPARPDIQRAVLRSASIAGSWRSAERLEVAREVRAEIDRVKREVERDLAARAAAAGATVGLATAWSLPPPPPPTPSSSSRPAMRRQPSTHVESPPLVPRAFFSPPPPGDVFAAPPPVLEPSYACPPLSFYPPPPHFLGHDGQLEAPIYGHMPEVPLDLGTVAFAPPPFASYAPSSAPVPAFADRPFQRQSPPPPQRQSRLRRAPTPAAIIAAPPPPQRPPHELPRRPVLAGKPANPRLPGAPAPGDPPVPPKVRKPRASRSAAASNWRIRPPPPPATIVPPPLAPIGDPVKPAAATSRKSAKAMRL